MTAPFPTPQYISYDNIKELLAGSIIIDPVYPDSGLSMNEINICIAEAEAFICNSLLSNYVELPLKTIDGGNFTDLANNPKWSQTYNMIYQLFTEQAVSVIQTNFYGKSGSSQGMQGVDNALRPTNQYNRVILALNQATNSVVMNLFTGLRLSHNRVKRQPSAGLYPNLFQGKNQVISALNSNIDMRWGFNR